MTFQALSRGCDLIGRCKSPKIRKTNVVTYSSYKKTPFSFLIKLEWNSVNFTHSTKYGLSSLKLALSKAEQDSLNKGNMEGMQATVWTPNPEDVPIRKADVKGGGWRKTRIWRFDRYQRLAHERKSHLHYLIFNLSIPGITGLKRHQKRWAV